MGSSLPIRNYWAGVTPQFIGQLGIAAIVLQSDGPKIAIEIHPPQRLLSLMPPGQTGSTPSSPPTGMALIDSGASMTVVDENALKQVGVSPIGSTTVQTPSGNATQLLYPAEFEFIGIGRYPFAAVIGSPHLNAQGIIALVGRDVLRNLIFTYNGVAGMFSLSF